MRLICFIDDDDDDGGGGGDDDDDDDIKSASSMSMQFNLFQVHVGNKNILSI